MLHNQNMIFSLKTARKSSSNYFIIKLIPGLVGILNLKTTNVNLT